MNLDSFDFFFKQNGVEYMWNNTFEVYFGILSLQETS